MYNIKLLLGLFVFMSIFAILFVVVFYRNTGNGDIDIDNQKDLLGLGASVGIIFYIIVLYLII